MEIIRLHSQIPVLGEILVLVSEVEVMRSLEICMLGSRAEAMPAPVPLMSVAVLVMILIAPEKASAP